MNSIKEYDKRENDNHLAAILCAALLGFFIYQIVLPQLSGTLNDYNGHVYQYLPAFDRGFFEGWKAVPYFLWHIVVLFLNRICLVPLEPAAAFSSCFFELAAYVTYYLIIRRVHFRLTASTGNTMSAFFALCLCLVQGYYFPWTNVSTDGYLGVFSMNPWHNPTQMCVLALSLIIFVFTVDLLGILSETGYEPLFFHITVVRNRHLLLLALLLLLSAIAKPTFAEMFIPAVALFMLFELCKRIGNKENFTEYFRTCLKMLLCSLPSLLYICSGFLVYFVVGNNHYKDTSVIITEWFQVWKLFSENVYLALLFGMAFPIYIFILDSRHFLQSPLGRLGLLGYICGLLEATLLGQSGGFMGHGDFLWPMMSGMTVIWLSSFIHLLTLDKTACKTRPQKWLLTIGWILFAGHVLCGVLLLRQYLSL